MRPGHGWPAGAFLAGFLASLPGVAAPAHVVSTFLCTDEYVFRLLPRAHIAALSFEAADRHPVVSTIADAVKGIPLVHNSAEEVLSLHPDVVVMLAGTELPLHTQLRGAGQRIIDIPLANSLADIRSVTLNLGHALGADARAHALVENMNRLLYATTVSAPPVRTLIYQPNGYAGSDRVTDEILGAAGLVDLATRSGTIPIETVVSSPPDLIILDGASDARPSLANLVLQHPAFKALARHTMIGRVALTPLLCPGPWSVSTVPQFAYWGRKVRQLARDGGAP